MAADPLTPFHAEAYPVIDLREARREVLAGRNLVVWRDQEGSLIGMAKLAFDVEDVLTIDAAFRKLPYLPSGSFKHRIACDVIPINSGQDDVLATSLGGQGRVRIIVFAAGEWRSRDYHRFGYRSKIVADSVRDAERLAVLERELAAGRSRYTRKTAHAALVAEQARLRATQGDRQQRPPPAHQQQVLTRSWMMQPSDRLEVTRLPPVPNGSDVRDVLELVGRPLFAGATAQDEAEKAITAAVRPVYRELSATTSRVSQLQVRRAIGAMEARALRCLDDELYLHPVPALEMPFGAALALPIEGDAQLLDRGSFSPGPERLPIGDVSHGELILEVAFSPDNAPFVPVLLQAELNFIHECLELQRKDTAQVAACWPATVKRIVAEQWPRLGRNRTRGRRT